MSRQKKRNKKYRPLAGFKLGKKVAKDKESEEKQAGVDNVPLHVKQTKGFQGKVSDAQHARRGNR